MSPPPAVALALKLTLLPWPLPFQPLKGITGHHGFPPVNFDLPMPFHSWLMVRHGTDRQTAAGAANWSGNSWRPRLSGGSGAGVEQCQHRSGPPRRCCLFDGRQRPICFSCRTTDFWLLSSFFLIWYVKCPCNFVKRHYNQYICSSSSSRQTYIQTDRQRPSMHYVPTLRGQRQNNNKQSYFYSAIWV